MDRSDLQEIAEMRIKDSEILIDRNAYAGAYYLAGYSIECALKACIAKQIRQHEFPDKKFILDSYTHDLDKLLNGSGLKNELNIAGDINPELSVNWSIIKDWTIDSRYDQNISRTRAQDLFDAIYDNTNGLLQWLRERW